jgi:hypothetical protein
MSVFVLHGTVDRYVRGAAAHRNYVPRDAFETYLRSRATPFVGWNAGRPEGDVLTVDDATHAGADACMTARRLGHEVMFFVNPFQITSGQPYFFSLLDTIIDARTAISVEYQGERYDLSTAIGAHRFRVAVRDALMVRRADEAYAAVAQLSALLGAGGIEIAPHDRPISPAELRVLKDAGIRIENHGWSHVDINSLTDDEFAEHVTAGREWLRRELSVDASLYAVPFGADDVPADRRRWVGDAYFLASRRFPAARLGPRCWNRKDLITEMRGQVRLRAYLAAKADQPNR